MDGIKKRDIADQQREFLRTAVENPHTNTTYSITSLGSEQFHTYTSFVGYTKGQVVLTQGRALVNKIFR